MKMVMRIVLVLSLLFLVRKAPAQEISFQYFYDALTPYGQWAEVEGYGFCWQPDIRESDWQPYAFGHWVSTDDGWLWVSDDSEPWGWMVYHYGRWINFEDRGWFWVPGYTWGPAWVTWRSGDDYCGWAPLPPSRYVGEISFGWFNFCPVRYMGAPSLRQCIVRRSYNYTIINRTVVIVGGRPYSGGRYYVQGPRLEEINRRSERPVPHYTVNRRTDVTLHGAENFRPRESGGSVTVYAPSVRREKTQTAAPASVAVAVSTPVVNTGNNAYRPPRPTASAPPSAEPNRWMNRAAVSSVYKQAPAPPSPQAPVVRPAVTPSSPAPAPRVESQPKREPAATENTPAPHRNQSQPSPRPEPQHSNSQDAGGAHSGGGSRDGGNSRSRDRH